MTKLPNCHLLFIYVISCFILNITYYTQLNNIWNKQCELYDKTSWLAGFILLRKFRGVIWKKMVMFTVQRRGSLWNAFLFKTLNSNKIKMTFKEVIHVCNLSFLINCFVKNTVLKGNIYFRIFSPLNVLVRQH